MKCIKEKCKHFREHDFRMSAFKCGLDTYHSHSKEGDMTCLLLKVVTEYENKIRSMIKYQEFIKDNQEEVD